MQLSLLLPKDYAEYDSFLLENPNRLFYASSKYLKFIQYLLSCQQATWIVKENGKIKGVLLLMSLSGPFGKVYNSLPFYGSNGGILADSTESYRLLKEKYLELISEDGVACANLISNPLDIENESSYESCPIDEKDFRIGQFTPLNYNEAFADNLMKSFHYKTRNVIRKAAKLNVKISVENEMFPFLKMVHNENMQAIGGKAKSDDFFDSIPTFFKEEKDYRIYVARNEDGEAIAALLVFYFNKTIEYFTPVIKQEYRSWQPMSLIIYQAMIDGAAANFDWWNWGGTWASQDGVYRFKSRWNTVDKKYHYYIKVNNPMIYQSSKEELLASYPNFFTIPFNKLMNV